MVVVSITAKNEIVDTGEEKTVKFSHVEMSFPCDINDKFFDNKENPAKMAAKIDFCRR